MGFGLLQGLGQGLQQAGQNMWDQAKQDRLMEWKKQEKAEDRQYQQGLLQKQWDRADAIRAEDGAAAAASKQADRAWDLTKMGVQNQHALGLQGAKDSRADSKFGSAKSGINPETQKPGYFQTNQAGETRWLDAIPQQKNGISIDKDGNIQIGGSGPTNLNKPAINDAQERVISHGESLARLKGIKDSYDPSFLTLGGKVRDWATNMQSTAGFDISPEDRKKAMQHRRFSQQVNYEFNSYRKLITGAAAAVAELEDLKKAMISTDLSPLQFEAAFDTYSDELSRTMRIRNKLLREGLQPGTEQYGSALDQLYMSGSDDDINMRGAELEQQGIKPEEIAKMLEQEGYF